MKQQLFHLIIISHRQTLSDHAGIKIIDYFQSTTTLGFMVDKDDFFSRETTFGVFLLLRIREGCMPAVTKPREDHCRATSIKLD